MPEPTAAILHAIVEAADTEDMLMVLDRVAAQSDVLAGVDVDAAAEALIVLLREAAAIRLAAEQAATLLTKRERQLACLLVAGLSNAELASRLGCTERTVRAHLEHMQRKTGAANRTGLLAAVSGLDIGFSANIKRHSFL